MNESNQDQRLREAVEQFGTDAWNRVAEYIGRGKRPVQCMRRWKRYLSPDGPAAKGKLPPKSTIAYYFDKEAVRE